MPYSARQCLAFDTLGLVPWVRRVGAPVRTVTQRSIDPPGILSWPELAEELPMRGVLPDADSWRRRQADPKRGAGLLVLFDVQPFVGGARSTDVQAEPARPASSMPPLGLQADSFRLFQSMLRAIGLAGTDVTLASLTAAPLPGTSSVSELLQVPHRAILVFLHPGPALGSAPDIPVPVGQGRLACWRCPHPDGLLEQPLGKREAWQVLKAVKCSLNADTV